MLSYQFSFILSYTLILLPIIDRLFSLLLGAVSRHHFHHQAPKKDSVLHRESHYSLCWNLLLISSRLLSTFRFRREGFSLNLYPTVSHCVLPLAGRDYPTNFTLSTPPRKGEIVKGVQENSIFLLRSDRSS